MKLATLKDGTRDGRLVVVSRDLTRYSDACHIAPTLQAALDNWANVAPASPMLQPASKTVPCSRTAFTNMRPRRPCPAPISGRTARPMSITWNWCAGRAAPKCRKVSGPIR